MASDIVSGQTPAFAPRSGDTPTHLPHEPALLDPLRPGFMGVTDIDVRAEALTMSISSIREAAYRTMNAAADGVKHTAVFLALADFEASEDIVDGEKLEAILWAIRSRSAAVDSSLCLLGGFVEALIVRLSQAEAGHGA